MNAKTASMKLLLVDDDDDVRNSIARRLTRHGHTVSDTGRPLKAIEFAKQQQFDVALVDLSMPEMNGHDATRAIREAEAGAEHRTPVVAVTAHAVNGDRETCFDAGMDDYLPKPISVDNLREMVERYLSEAEQRKTG